MNWRAVHRKLWVVVLVPLVAASIAFILTYEKAGQYKSIATVEASVPDKPTKTQTLKDIEDPNQYYENMVGTMKTELITSMVSYRLLLHDLEKEIAFRPPAIQYTTDRKARIKSTLEKKLSSFELLSETVPMEETIAQIIHNSDYDIARWIREGEMTIQRKEGTNEILVSTTTEDPFLSAFASNALSQEYIRYETTIFAPAPSNDSIGYYREEVDRLRKDMEAKAGELSEISAREKTPVNDIRLRREKANRISEYEMRILEEESELSGLLTEMAKLQRSEGDGQVRPTADVASNAKIQAARKKIDQLSAMYADGGSKDKQIDSIITVLRKQVNDEALRIQMASSGSRTSTKDREKDILQGRINKHEQNIASIRNDIRRLRNTNISGTNNNNAEIAQLKTSQGLASRDYNLALSKLKALEAREGVTTATTGRADHYLVLKAKALPSAEPESPWAIFIIIGSFIGTLIICIVIFGAKKQAPQIPDDIFLRANYMNRQRPVSKQPTTT